MSGKKTVADLYRAAASLYASEFQTLNKGQELNDKQREKADQLGKVVTNWVLKDMGII